MIYDHSNIYLKKLKYFKKKILTQTSEDSNDLHRISPQSSDFANKASLSVEFTVEFTFITLWLWSFSILPPEFRPALPSLPLLSVKLIPLNDVPVNQGDKRVFLVSPLGGLFKKVLQTVAEEWHAWMQRSRRHLHSSHRDTLKFSKEPGAYQTQGCSDSSLKGRGGGSWRKKSPPWIGFIDFGLGMKGTLTCAVVRFSLIKALAWVQARPE